MKKIIILLFILAIAQNSLAQKVDSIDVLLKKINIISKTAEFQKTRLDSLASAAHHPANKYYIFDYTHRIPLLLKALICLPLVLLIFFFFVITLRLNKEGYKFRRALYDDPVSMDVPNSAYKLGDPPDFKTIKKIYFKPSASRLIAFLSGVTAIIISISATTYFFYMYFRTGVEPNLDKLFDILLALGIGVTPYAVGKVSNAIAK